MRCSGWLLVSSDIEGPKNTKTHPRSQLRNDRCNLEACQYLNFPSLGALCPASTSESITEAGSPEPVENSVTRGFSLKRCRGGLFGPTDRQPRGASLGLHAGLAMIASSAPATPSASTGFAVDHKCAFWGSSESRKGLAASTSANPRHSWLRGPDLNCGSDSQVSKFWWIIDSDLSPASTSRSPWRRGRDGRKWGLLRALTPLGFSEPAGLGRERSTGFSVLFSRSWKCA